VSSTETDTNKECVDCFQALPERYMTMCKHETNHLCKDCKARRTGQEERDKLLDWGLKGVLIEQATMAWGCRAIFSGGVIDIVHDRQSFWSKHEDKLKSASFFLLINSKIMELAREQAKEIYDEDAHCLCQRLLGTPRWRCMARASGGYLYMTIFTWE